MIKNKTGESFNISLGETMERYLRKISDTVQKYAEIIAKVSRVDVEVVDDQLYRVAGTGMYADMVNQDMSQEGYIYRKVLQSGQRQIIYHPGMDPLCTNCPKCSICKEQVEISMPIRLGRHIIGVIGLVGSDAQQKQLILQNETTYLQLLDQIAEFIASKAREQVEAEQNQAMINALGRIIDHVEQGILILGEGDVVTKANQSACHQLGTTHLEDNPIQVMATGDQINGNAEYKLLLNGRTSTVMGELCPLHMADERYGKMLIFQESRNIHSHLYTMTTTVDPHAKELIGSSPKTEALRREIEKVADSTSTVLITGESGTGKEMVATSIWRAGNRRDKRFVAINCGAIPEALLESELFGYVKGAFTGADPNGRVGKFELANQGVIFLDEIGDMPLYLQVKLLRVLQERTITRIGSNQVIPIDVRVIAATNKDLRDMIETKKFREDLYYRLNVIPIHIAPLRERVEDVEELTYLFVQRYAKLFGKRFCGIEADTMHKLQQYPWYGNVRELENTIEFMVNMMESNGILDDATLPKDFSKQLVKEPKQIRSLKQLEQEEIGRALEYYGNTTRGKQLAAKKLGIGLATLYRKLEEIDKQKTM